MKSIMNNKHFMIRTDKAEIFNCKNQPKGFTLIELMIAMAVGLVVLSAVYAVFTVQNKQLNKQEQIALMQQNARMAMDMMTREIMMAGYGATSALPRCSGTTTATNMPCVGITAGNANSISFSADLDGDEDLTADSSNPNENITYDIYTSSGILALGRVTNGTRAPVVENISALTFAYRDAAGVGTTNLLLIRTIQISITAQTADIDPDLGAVRTFTLTSNVTPRNLGMTVY